jgi:hypothetical protein
VAADEAQGEEGEKDLVGAAAKAAVMAAAKADVEAAEKQAAAR